MGLLVVFITSALVPAAVFLYVFVVLPFFRPVSAIFGRIFLKTTVVRLLVGFPFLIYTILSALGWFRLAL